MIARQAAASMYKQTPELLLRFFSLFFVFAVTSASRKLPTSLHSDWQHLNLPPLFFLPSLLQEIEAGASATNEELSAHFRALPA